jgi:hypothetical protein
MTFGSKLPHGDKATVIFGLILVSEATGVLKLVWQ